MGARFEMYDFGHKGAPARKRLTLIRITTGLLLAGALAPFTHAGPGPGDVFREYIWNDGGRWQRITGPDATMEGAKAFLPNKVNVIELSDLAGAIRLEVQLELLQSHYGTVGQALRLNAGRWIPIPPPPHIPGEAGSREGPPESWLTMLHPAVDVPLAHVKPGANTFEFTCRNGSGLGSRWPQSIVYGVTFRVYYGAGKTAPSGRVSVPVEKPGRFGTIELIAEPVAAGGGAIRRVDFLARYLGYDWRGEGVRHDWHYHTHYGELRRHAGSALAAPWRAAWDIRGIPAQDAPVQVAARIADDTGLIRITEAVTLESFRGAPHTRIFSAHDVPPAWQTRAGRRNSCTITLPDDLSGLREAKIILASWNGDQAGTIGINDMVLVRNIGFNHDLSYDELTVPISVLRPGENVFFTTSDTLHHGIEVLWPGVVLLARFAAPGAAH
jgi:hypothetical protein